MTTEGELIKEEEVLVAPRVSEWRRFRRVFFKRGVVTFGLVILVILILTAILAPLIAPYDPYEQDWDQTLAQPSREHLLGTDAVGRDTLSRIIYGTRTSLMVGVIAVGVAALCGMTLGLIAGYFGGIVNMIIMRLVDALMAFPMILLALTIAAVLGGGIRNLMLAIGLSMMSGYARVMAAEVMMAKEKEYVTAERSIGAGNLRIMLKHILPNCLPPFIVMITMMLGGAIMAEASMSFIGIGIEAPTAAWGAMVYAGYQFLLTNPVLSIAPGVAIILVVFTFNMVGDGLRDALDPRLRGAI